MVNVRNPEFKMHEKHTGFVHLSVIAGNKNIFAKCLFVGSVTSKSPQILSTFTH